MQRATPEGGSLSGSTATAGQISMDGAPRAGFRLGAALRLATRQERRHLDAVKLGEAL